MTLPQSHDLGTFRQRHRERHHPAAGILSLEIWLVRYTAGRIAAGARALWRRRRPPCWQVERDPDIGEMWSGDE